MASVRRWDQDAETADQYGLSLTDAGPPGTRRRPDRMTPIRQ
jgi:hypothetical protein